MKDPNAYADVVILTIKAALGPVLERLALAEQSNKELQAKVVALTDLRYRLTTVETKAAAFAEHRDPEPIDLGPFLERIAALESRNKDLETRLQDVTMLRERVVAVETKALAPTPLPAVLETKSVDLTPLTERVTALETRFTPLVDVRDRVVALETKAAIPVPTQVETITVGLTKAETELSLRDYLEPLTKELSSVRERVAVVEVRQPVPGPAGKDGANGKDGADGLGFEDFSAELDGNRTLLLKFERGTVKKVFPIVLPFQRYQGVYQEGKSYTPGDMVTWAGSTWNCGAETTMKPGDGSKDWTLCVKRGRDGRDGVDAPGALPVVTVGRS